VMCPEERLVAFLAGELAPEQERSFDEHLLGCEQCWRAVQADRAARLALEQLRQPAPTGLQGRVAASVALAAAEARNGPVVVGRHPISQYRAPSFLRRAATRPHVRLVAAACLLAAVAAGSFGWLAASRRAAPEPAQVAAVVAMMTPGSAPTTALRAGEHLVIAGQHLVVRAYQLEGTEEIVASSARPFPVPSTSHLLSGPSPQAWMATKGHLSMYGVNRRGPGESMFVVAAMPMAEMPQMAARLGLI
jgi:anti-sigma factor RsiW